jgi:hypothetical protein
VMPISKTSENNGPVTFEVGGPTVICHDQLEAAGRPFPEHGMWPEGMFQYVRLNVDKAQLVLGFRCSTAEHRLMTQKGRPIKRRKPGRVLTW